MVTDGTETVVPEQVPPQEPTQEPQVPTAEEQMKQLQAQLLSEMEAKKKSEESYKGLQRKFNQLNEELKKQVGVEAELKSLKETQKIFAAMLAERENIPEGAEGMPPERKQDYLKKFEEIEAKRERDRQLAEFQTKIKEFQERTETLGLTEESPEYWDIEEAATRGNFRKAEAIIKRMEKAKQPQQPAKETEEDVVKKKIEEEVQKRLAELAKTNPLLKTDNLSLSGKGTSKQEVIARYARGEATDEEYMRALGQK